MPIDPDTIADDTYAPEKLVADYQAVEKVKSTFDFLAEVTIQHAIEEKTHIEIAECMGLPVSTVRRAWRQARIILREHL